MSLLLDALNNLFEYSAMECCCFDKVPLVPSAIDTLILRIILADKFTKRQNFQLIGALGKSSYDRLLAQVLVASMSLLMPLEVNVRSASGFIQTCVVGTDPYEHIALLFAICSLNVSKRDKIHSVAHIMPKCREILIHVIAHPHSLTCLRYALRYLMLLCHQVGNYVMVRRLFSLFFYVTLLCKEFEGTLSFQLPFIFKTMREMVGNTCSNQHTLIL